MTKSRKNRKSNMLKSLSSKAIPAVGKGLRTVGFVAKGFARKSVPIVEKGVSVVYETMATGLDLGVKGAKTVASGLNKMSTRRRRSSKRRSSRRR